MKKLVIAIGTLNRPKMLEQALRSFQSLHVPHGLSTHLLLVDNDPGESARAVFTKVSHELPMASHYAAEPKKGIVYMRNRAIEEALAMEATHMAFIDDDEEVFPKWLEYMWQALHKYDAQVAVSGVQRKLPDNSPAWIVKGKYFERPHFATGTERNAASTSNVLFDLMICREWGLRFHPALNLCGSSDTFLFNQAHERGAKIIWVKEAVVSEEIPESRANLQWILKRSFRYASARTARMILKKGYGKALVSETFYGFSQLFWGIVELPGTFFLGKVGWVNALRKICKFGGSMAGLAGYKYPEYKKTHGH
jgi:glycosyltransferase involved in cell wall biosynthesis